jgi:hypothetical protein
MSAPELSVVIPAVNTYGDLHECLSALSREGTSVHLELLIIDRSGAGSDPRIRSAFPGARVIPVDASVTIPQMRALAFETATAPAVAVIEDHVIVPPGWARRMQQAASSGDRVVAGSVENAATDTLLDWAAFLCEYSHCLPPIPAGPAEWLTGNNVVYPKALLDRYRHVTQAGKWENYLHDSLKRDGVPLICDPTIVVGHRKHYTFAEYLSQRYLYARSYAGARVAEASAPIRAAYALSSVALPPLLFYRTVSRILGKRRHVSLLVRSLPLIAVFVLSWAAGEAVGYARGAGNSLARVC